MRKLANFKKSMYRSLCNDYQGLAVFFMFSSLTDLLHTTNLLDSRNMFYFFYARVYMQRKRKINNVVHMGVFARVSVVDLGFEPIEKYPHADFPSIFTRSRNKSFTHQKVSLTLMDSSWISFQQSLKLQSQTEVISQTVVIIKLLKISHLIRSKVLYIICSNCFGAVSWQVHERQGKFPLHHGLCSNLGEINLGFLFSVVGRIQVL